MIKILFWLGILIFTASLGRAQDAGTQQQLDKLSGAIQDIQATQELQGKRLAALEKQISDLSDKLNTPAVSDSASRDDLKTLAAQVQEIDKKRQDDRELILKQIENLGKVSGGSPTGHNKPKPAPDTTSAAGGDNSTAPAVPQKGYEYKVQAGDTIGAIAKAYRDQGVKITSGQILKANPKLDPSKLYVGQKIFIPDPNAK
jgi:LysM repeat protein